MVNKILINKFILVGLLSYFFVLAEISLLNVLCTLFVIVPIWDFVAWNLLFFGAYIVLIYLVLNSRVFRLYFSLILVVIPGATLIFLALFQQYTFIDILLFITVPIAFVAILIISKLKHIKIGRGAVVGLVICFLVIFFVVVLPGDFFFMKIELSILCFSAIMPLTFSLRFITHRAPTIKHFNIYAKYLLISSILISGSILFLPVKSIRINADTRPDIVFWTSTGALPDNDTLSFCAQNRIGFAVVIRESYIEDGGVNEAFDIKRALDRGVNIYIAIGGPTGDVFLTLDNAEKFIDLFKSIRSWMKDNSLYNNSHFRAFLVDAEPPIELIDDLSDYEFVDKAQYFINKVSIDTAEKEAKESLEKLIDLIHSDDKEVGIVKMPNCNDELDSDNDYSVLMRNVYNLDLKWDLSVTMIYRTQHIPDIFDYMIEDLSQYDYTSDSELSYLEKSDLERYLIPTSTFYYKTAYEISSSEVNVKKDNRYIFIGTFKEKFEDTSYITQKEYLTDIDICRHFSVDTIFLYDFSGFIGRYGTDELKEMVRHINENEGFSLNIPAYYLQKELLYSVSAVFIDKLLYI